MYNNLFYLQKKGATMTNSTDRKKIANIYIDANTHDTIKRLASHQGNSMQTVISNWLDETQPAMNEMVKALDDIKNGKDMNLVLRNLMSKGLQIASDNLSTNEEQQDATDNRQSD